MNYKTLDKLSLQNEYQKLKEDYNDYLAQNLNLNMARGKPSPEQTDLSSNMLSSLISKSSLELTIDGIDCRNYGGFDGIPSIKKIFAPMLGVSEDNIFVGGNSSLNLMFDIISLFYTHGVSKDTVPWGKQDKIKFLCPVPGYDRHFSITEYFGFEMIPIPMLSTGPDMDKVEHLIENDSSIKGIWCVPKYSNPTGVTYSDDTVKRFARLSPKANDFRIMWDNAYCVHDLGDISDKLLNIMTECKKTQKEDLPIIFTSTSKITFPGAGVAAIGASDNNMRVIRERYTYATIGYNKLNQLWHARFLKDYDNLLSHMQKHKDILRPKFDAVQSVLQTQLGNTGIAQWYKPNGGYFVSINVLNGTAKRVVGLCKEAGVIFTAAGATFPLGIDPDDSNIRIAPTFPPLGELNIAMELFCVCVKLAAIEKLLSLQ